MSQGDVADALGISAVHINRVLQALRTSGLITWSNQQVVIPDVQALKAFAEFEPGYLCFDGFGAEPAMSRPQPPLACAS